MKISLEWLSSYLSQPVQEGEADYLLTHQGFPIETRQSLAGGDVMLDVEITSNRGDCLSHLGIAREIAAGTSRSLVLPDGNPPAGTTTAKIESITSVQVADPRLCSVYTARVIRNVKVGPSPDWAIRRLQAVGLRSVNNVADATNYVLFEMGQPLHAFDLAKLQEKRIVVRAAKKGEAFTAIDGSRHKLDENMLVIADATRPIALAGVMGGLDTEVGPNTRDVLLESAIFAPLSVRQTSRSLKLAGDSSYRFERGVDPVGVDAASSRAAKLICEWTGGQLVQGVIRVGANPPEPRRISLRPDRCRAILGYDLPTDRIIQVLGKLSLSPQPDPAGKSITCTAPSHRLDLSREIDLIEEVARLAGLDQVPMNPQISTVVRPVQPAVAAQKAMRDVLVAHGYLETMTFSFIPPKTGEPFLPPGRQAVMIDDERRKREPMLRPSLLPSLLACRKTNQDVGNTAIRLFESAAAWTQQAGKILESRRLGLLLDVEESAGPDLTLRLLRGTLNDLLNRLAGSAAITIEPVQAGYLSTAGKVMWSGQELGVLGLISPTIQKLFELHTPVAVADLDLEQLLAQYPPQRKVQPLGRFPGIERDLSVVVDEQVRWKQFEQAVEQTRPAMLEELRFVTVYRGKPVPAGRKSVTLRMVFRDPQRTLRHEEVDPQVSAVLARLTADLGAELRK